MQFCPVDRIPAPAAHPALLPAPRVVRERTLTETPRPGEPVAAVFQRLAVSLAAQELELLGVMIYGGLMIRAEVERTMRDTLGEIAWPVTWVEAAGCGSAPLAGVQAFAISGRPVQRLRVGRQVVGSVYEDGDARHCLLGGLAPTAIEGMERGAQVRQMLGNLEWALDAAGFQLADVVRTWFYNDDILGWYGEFNRARTAHYANVAWRTGSLPASTGIGARNAAGAALTLAAWAVQPLNGHAVAREIASPLQCPAPAYGSAFSRAVEIESGGWRRLFVSGTASIHPDGRTAWVGHPRKQVDLTMEVIAAMLHSRGMDYRAVTRATAYFRAPGFETHFNDWRRDRELGAMPVVATHSVVCRDDLLFELELDAVAPAGVRTPGG
jgi:enamine deaminase RidA (YjgF/YER057c/UK114 family)